MLTKRGYVALTMLVLGGIVGGTQTAQAVTLDTLLSGGTLTVGNATYSNFVYGGITPATSVTVNASTLSPGVSEITFARTVTPWTLADHNSVISYHVDFATPITSIGLDFAGTASGGAVADVGETATGGGKDYSLQVSTGIGPSVFASSLTFGGPISSLDVVKSIDILGATGSGTITTVDNTYSAVPEPASLGLLGVGALALIRRRR